jgi:hypothetical protein
LAFPRRSGPGSFEPSMKRHETSVLGILDEARETPVLGILRWATPAALVSKSAILAPSSGC